LFGNKNKNATFAPALETRHEKLAQNKVSSFK